MSDQKFIIKKRTTEQILLLKLLRKVKFAKISQATA